ncbi:hypothetical protein M885DRAFT_548531 [Pelagophyceae sp. CCMP2097]|nr:hypothetical protein M885DRAFT_548531 [Pelagophyceae sp. CCMP2097]
MSGLWGFGALVRTLAALQRRVGESVEGRSADEEAGRGDAPSRRCRRTTPWGSTARLGLAQRMEPARARARPCAGPRPT